MREQLFARRSVTAALTASAISAPALASRGAPDGELLSLGSELEQIHAARLAFDKINSRDDDPYYEPHWQLREAINRVPATTRARLAVKARAAQLALHHDPANECECDGAFRDLSCSLIDDLLKITAKEGLHA